MIEAVQSGSHGPRPPYGPDGPGAAAELTPEGRDSLFGYEVLSAWMGRAGSDRNPFSSRLAVVGREPKQKLTVTRPEDLGRDHTATVVATGGKEDVVPIRAGKATLQTIEDSEDIASVVIRDRDGRPVALTGRLGRVASNAPQ
ncbi:hypothetical protein GCM10009726_24480 [Nocardioides furvisabuli]|uniref:Uncharacterized protein n=2 Tax=Nocardioides furvisabuli TaxID=375542 RepID=A0ABP5J1R8_9ACTN